MHSFEKALSVSITDIEFELSAFLSLAWADFLLNPRRLRGSDFLMRWSQGVWSEERLREAVDNSDEFFALPYGPSGTAPSNDVRAFELYFERLEAAGLGKIKRPDLLIFRKSDSARVQEIVDAVGGIAELPFIAEDDITLRQLLDKAIIAVECENSLWKASMMPDYGTTLRPQKRLGGKLGLSKSAVLPTVIIKDEDRQPLQQWQLQNKIEIHVWHLFYDLAFGISFDESERLIAEGLIQPSIQTFQAPGGATTKKSLYKFYYHYAYPLGHATAEPSLLAANIIDKNGHILPYVRFEGGRMLLNPETLAVLREVANVK